MNSIPLALALLLVCPPALAAPAAIADDLRDSVTSMVRLPGAVAPEVSSFDGRLDFRDFALTGDAPDNADRRSASDYLFPRKGKSLATFATGIPYVAVAERAYGFTDRFSVGVLGGIVPHNPGFGVRLRYVLAQPSEDFRVHLKMPILYYPKAKSLGCPGCEPWFLAWPALSAEWRRPSGTRWWVGTGVVAAACADTVFGRENEAMETGGGIQEGTWNTLQFGFSKPITRRLAFQLEVAPVLKGGKLATRKNWVGGPSVILTTGFSYSF